MGGAIQKNSHLWDREPDNWYVEEAWCSQRLFEVEDFPGRVVDPCAGMGNVVTGGFNAGIKVEGYDLRDRGFDGVVGGVDFFSWPQFPGRYPVDCVVSNSPYGVREAQQPVERKRLEEEFIRLALARTRCKVAVLLQSTWDCGSARSSWLQGLPLYRKYNLTPRPSMPPGPVIEAGEKPGGGTKDYAWYVFLHGFQGDPTLHWLRRDD
ncbi:MAG: hypothetical protein AAF674_16865 [Pseudomonadota bacterium]